MTRTVLALTGAFAAVAAALFVVVVFVSFFFVSARASLSRTAYDEYGFRGYIKKSLPLWKLSYCD